VAVAYGLAFLTGRRHLSPQGGTAVGSLAPERSQLDRDAELQRIGEP
jgi:hypothetical protein